MKLLTQELRERLIKNGVLQRRAQEARPEICLDFLPVARLFTPDANATWLLTEIDPDDHDRAFGLCDLGLGFPELGYVSLAELAALRGPLRLPVEREHNFIAARTISAYAEEARAAGRIVA